jgi:dienelactone hydrolase
MKTSCLLLLCLASGTAAQAAPAPAPRQVRLKSADGAVLAATYFDAGKPGPGVLLFHQSNRTRKSWDEVAAQLAAAGIHTLAVDSRGHGESGGSAGGDHADEKRIDDLDAAFRWLVSQPGVTRDLIGVGGAGWLGVHASVETARRHPRESRSLVLISGETLRPGLEFLHHASQLPELFVVSDGDEYPPTAEAMELLYVTASSPAKKLVHYSAKSDAPWLWYEPVDAGHVPATGEHGTDLLKTHPELAGIVVQWFVTTLLETPGHAPADTLAAASVLNQLELPGGAGDVTRQLASARRTDPKAQLFPEVTASIVGQDYLRIGDGQRDLARAVAEKAMAILDAHALPASSWSDTEQRRGEIRSSAMQTLEATKATH